MSITQLNALREELKALRLEHRMLDDKITELVNDSYMSSLDIQRLKKRKLLLKEAIVKIESKLIPDMNA